MIDLAGFDLQIKWDTAYLAYVSHTATLGCLNAPTFMTKNDVDANGPGTYWLAAASLNTTDPGFDGTGTAATLTFRVLQQPLVGEDDVDLLLQFTSSDLADTIPNPIQHDPIDGMVTIHPAPATVKIVPENIEFGPDRVVGLEFNVSLVIENVGDLAGLDLQLTWDTEYLYYVNHTALLTCLDAPTFMTKNDVDAIAGAYWLAAASLNAVDPGFDGNGTAAILTFRIVKQPLIGEDDKSLSLGFTSTDLANSYPEPIPHDDVNGTIIVHAGSIRDVRVVSIIPLRTYVGQGFWGGLVATVENQGDYTETFNMTIYANETEIAAESLTLFSRSNASMLLFWDTTDFAKGNYLIKVTVSELPGESNTSDNILLNGWVLVTIPGDGDGDRDVDIFDIVKMAGIYGVEEPDPRYEPNWDIDGDGDIDIFDLVIAAGNYGKSW